MKSMPRGDKPVKRARAGEGYAIVKDRVHRVKDKAVAAYVATHVLGREILDQGNVGDAAPAFVVTACGDKFCRAHEREKPAGWRCSVEGAGFSCLCGHAKGDTITMVQAALGVGFFEALQELDRALPGRAVRTDRTASGDLFGATAPSEMAMRGKAGRS
ncbi:hypothetical protein PbB2_00078 [Candidatus Phycosocius bacilliformis]|uniref:Uncharacterized protein n=1 Tax=Candidatus Phycosocius bacilliformis TaxID=1445552 RepID=A0A2P2E5U5_9PROT|nr:hypothetical protein [Candidatus Phycosocius bacilliformis]GBF56422.1 hypothetical protein PbB2_00078 [Candidatus Phycosocius bacilliformis]